MPSIGPLPSTGEAEQRRAQAGFIRRCSLSPVFRTVAVASLYRHPRYTDIQAFHHRAKIITHLRSYIPGYEKGTGNIYATTEPLLSQAVGRAERLVARFAPLPGTDPYTRVHEVVQLLRSIRPPVRWIFRTRLTFIEERVGGPSFDHPATSLRTVVSDRDRGQRRGLVLSEFPPLADTSNPSHQFL
jgi:hypothetical protein